MKRNNRGNILVMGESKSFLNKASTALKKSGYMVSEALNVKDAVVFINEIQKHGQDIDLIVAELGVPISNFHEKISYLYEKNIFIPTLPVYSQREPYIDIDSSSIISGEKEESNFSPDLVRQVRMVMH